MLAKRFLKGGHSMGLGMGDKEGSVDRPWLTGDQAQGATGTSCLCWGRSPGRWPHVWAAGCPGLGAGGGAGSSVPPCGLIPSCPRVLAGSGECPVLVAGMSKGWGHWG